MTPSLAIFDVDGTLVDSQAQIVGAMRTAFEGAGLAAPDRAAILAIVGLSLPVAMARLAPQADAASLAAMEVGYREAFAAQRRAVGAEGAPPLFPGIGALLDDLGARPDIVLGVATGKSRRGLVHLLESHDLSHRFLTVQVADDHPSKPHPAMLQAAMAETGIGADRAVMIGDTSFDMEMARAAGITGLGVGWGYHAPDLLRQAGATSVADDTPALARALDRLWREVA